MKKGFILLLVSCAFNYLDAQIVKIDTLNNGTIFVQKDSRIDVLGEKMSAYNTNLSKNIRSGKGFRLMLLTSNDRNLVMQTRSKLLQQFPEHKIYMIYQSPFIKLKMGNFLEKADAEKLKKQLLSQKIITGNIYILEEVVEIKPGTSETNN
ncbi:MAG: hypothetical protein WEA59_00230 [Ferruginibacter sp.]